MSGNGVSGMKGASDFSDLKSLRASNANIRAVRVETPASKHRAEQRGKQFIKVPMIWMERLARTTRRSTLVVALALLRSAWQNLGQPVALSNERLAEYGVSRKEKCLAIAELEVVGLIKVERSNCRSPRVTLLKM